MKFKKKIEIRPAFDRRSKDPRKDYGIHGCTMLFTLIGEHGAITFMLYTNWQLPHVREELESKLVEYHLFHPLPADIGYHSPHAMYEGQKPRDKVCEYIGVPCYQDGSACDADDYYNELLTKGSKGLWKKMIKYYKNRFVKAKE